METINSTRKAEKWHYISKEEVSITDLCMGVGILVCTCLILYFCLMMWGNFHEILLLRLLNLFILFGGILFAFHLYGKAIHDKIEYFTGLKIGIGVALVGVIPFALFIAFYLSYDTHLMQAIQQSARIVEHLNPATAAGAVCIEGLISGAILSFILMQYYKRNEL